MHTAVFDSNFWTQSNIIKHSYTVLKSFKYTRYLNHLPLSVWEQVQISVVWNLSKICFILSCKHIEDWVAKTAFSEKENLAILILTKANKSWTKEKIKSQHLHECSIKTSIGVGDENLIPT